MGTLDEYPRMFFSFFRKIVSAACTRPLKMAQNPTVNILAKNFYLCPNHQNLRSLFWPCFSRLFLSRRGVHHKNLVKKSQKWHVAQNFRKFSLKLRMFPPSRAYICPVSLFLGFCLFMPPGFQPEYLPLTGVLNSSNFPVKADKREILQQISQFLDFSEYLTRSNFCQNLRNSNICSREIKLTKISSHENKCL